MQKVTFWSLVYQFVLFEVHVYFNNGDCRLYVWKNNWISKRRAWNLLLTRYSLNQPHILSWNHPACMCCLVLLILWAWKSSHLEHKIPNLLIFIHVLMCVCVWKYCDTRCNWYCGIEWTLTLFQSSSLELEAQEKDTLIDSLTVQVN